MLIKELMEKAGKARADAEAILENAKKEKREMTTEESTRFDTLMDERDKHKADADKAQAADDAYRAEVKKREERLAAARQEDGRPQPRRTQDPAPGRGAGEDRGENITMEFRGNTVTYRPGTNEHRRSSEEYRQEFNRVLKGEVRVLQSDLDTDGGYLIAPEMFVLEVLRDLDNETYVRKYARKWLLDAGKKMTVPKRTAKAATFAWGGELTRPTPDTSTKFGRKTLDPHYMSGLVLVSRDLLESAAISVDAIVREEMAINAAELEEQAFMTGSGSGQPLGVFTASADGISTSRDVSTGNTSTQIKWDGLINCVHSIKLKYRAQPGFAWMFSGNAIRDLRKEKDGSGQYIWSASVVAGQPDRILNIPYIESEWVPQTFTTGQYVGILGDWSKYWIADSTQVQMQVLIEKYAEDNENGYLVRRKVDAAPAVGEAFARVKLG